MPYRTARFQRHVLGVRVVKESSGLGRRIVALGPGPKWPGQGLRASTPRKDFGLPRHGFRCTIIVASLAAAYAPRRPTVLHQAVERGLLSLPHELRMLAALKPAVLGALARLFVEAIFGMYRRRARRAGHVRPQCGAVMFVQRFGGSLDLNVHFHVVLMDGVFTRDEGARVHFHEAEAPSEEELLGLATQTYTNAVRWLRRHGHLADSTPAARGNGDVQIEALQGCAEIAMQRGSFAKAVAEGHDDAASRKRSFPLAKSRFVAECEGFNVHAAVRIPRGDDLGRERLCRLCRAPHNAVMAQDRPWRLEGCASSEMASWPTE